MRLTNLLNSYEFHPVYFIEYSQQGCFFEIRINDCLIAKKQRNGASRGTMVNINPFLLNSGPQKISVKIVPMNNDSSIKENALLTLKIGYTDLKKIVNYSERKWTWVYTLPIIKENIARRPFVFYEDTFEATIPYKLTGWTNCIALDKITNAEELIKNKFLYLHSLIISKNYTELKKEFYYKHYEFAIATYQTNEEFETKFERFIHNLSLKDTDYFQPIEDYKFVIYANGKMGTLESTKLGWLKSALLWLKDMGDHWDFASIDVCLGIDSRTNKTIIIR